MKKINYILAIFFLFTSCNFSNNLIEEKGDNQKFRLKRFNSGVDIFLREDFSFINFSYGFACTGGYSVKWFFGDYKMESEQVFFTPKKMILEEDWGGGHYHFDTTKNVDTVDYYISDSTKIHLTYWHIKNEKIEFLISDTLSNELDEWYHPLRSSNFIAFANLYNSNIVDEICYSVFCNIDTIANIRHFISKENIPEKFRELFLDEPIEVTVKSITVVKERSPWHQYHQPFPIYTLTSDRVDEIFIGMTFYLKEYKHPYYPITVVNKKDGVVIAKGANLNYEKDTKLKIGTTLKTESVYSVYSEGY